MKLMHVTFMSALALVLLDGPLAKAVPVPLINVAFNDAAGNQSLANRGSVVATGTANGSTVGFSNDVPPTNTGGWSGDFNGVGSMGDFGDDNVDFGDIAEIDGLTSITITAWVKGIAFHANGSRVSAKQNNPAGYDFSILSGTSGDPEGIPAIAAGGVSISSAVEIGSLGGRIPLNTWRFIAASLDTTTDTLTWHIGDGTTLNSTPETSVFDAGPVAASSLPLLIGNFRFAGRAFQGLIDDVQIFGEALSTSDVSAVMRISDVVPEPSTCVTLLLGSVLILGRRKVVC